MEASNAIARYAYRTDRPKMDDLFDYAKAQRLKEQAIDRVEEAAPDEWLEAAQDAVLFVCQRLHQFTTDDIWQAMPEDIRQLREPRAMGAIMRQAARDGLCVATDRTRNSARAACHGRPLRIWRAKR